MLEDLATIGVKVDNSQVDDLGTSFDKTVEKGAKFEGSVRKVEGVSKLFDKTLRDAIGAINANTAALMGMANSQDEVANKSRKASDAITETERRMASLKASIDPVGASIDRMNGELAEATALFKAGALSEAQYANALNILNGRIDATTAKQAAMAAGHGRATATSKAMTQATLNMTRQFADVGTTLAMGMNPLMVLIQQGPQIADGFQMAATQGLGFKAVMAGLYAQAAPLLAILLPIVAIVAAAAAGFALLHNQLSKGYPKDITDGLGLTADQLERVEHKTVTFGDTFSATIEVVGKHLMDGPIGDGLRWLEDRTQQAMDFISKAVLNGIANVIAFFQTAWQTITNDEFTFTQKFEAIWINLLNQMATPFEKFTNWALDKLSPLLTKMVQAAAMSEGMSYDDAKKINLGKVQVPKSFFYGKVSADNPAGDFFADTFETNKANALAGMGSLGDEIGATALRNARAKALKEAGKAGKGPADKKEKEDKDPFGIEAFIKAQERANKAVAGFKWPKPDNTDMDMLAVADTQDKFAAGLEVYADRLAQAASQTRSLAADMAASFGSVGKAIGDVAVVMADYDAKRANIQANQARGLADYEAAYAKAKPGEKYKLDIEWKRKQEAAASDLADMEIRQMGDVLGAAKGFFKERSVGYKVLEAGEKAFRLYEFAMSAKSIAVKVFETAMKLPLFHAQTVAAGAAGAANMFATLGPLGFAAVAAMGAVLAAWGFAGGGGGSAPALPTAKARQEAQGAGSVFGDAAAKSESLVKSLDLASKYQNKDLDYSNQMVGYLKAIQNNIGALANSLVQALSANGVLSTANLGLGKTGSAATLSNLGFGNTTTTSLNDQGLNFGSQSIGDIVNGGISGNSFQELITNTKKKAFGITYSNKTKNSEVTNALDSDLTGQLTDLISSLRSGVLEAARALGLDGAQATLDAFTLNIGKLSFKDMSGAEITEALNAIFGKLGDDLARAVGGGLVDQFQQIGEGALETLTRIATGVKVFDDQFKLMGMTFTETGSKALYAKQGLIDLAGGLDAFLQQTNFFIENFLSDAEQIAPIEKAVSAQMDALGYAGVKSKEAFKNLVLGIDTTTEAGQALFASLMNVAPAFLKVADYNQTLADQKQSILDKALETAINERDSAKQDLTTAYNNEASAIGNNISKFKAWSNTFKSFMASLVGGSYAALSPENAYNAAKSAFETTRSKALTGDETALNNLQSVSQAYLDASKDYYSTSQGYFDDLEAVKTAVEAATKFADQQVDIQQNQLNALNASVSGLIDINTSVLSVRDAIIAFMSKNGAVVAAGGSSAAGNSGYNSNGTVGGDYYDSTSDTWNKSTVSVEDLAKARAGGMGNDPTAPAGQDNGYLAGLINSYRNGDFYYLKDEDGNPTGVAKQLADAGFAKGGAFSPGGIVRRPTNFSKGGFRGQGGEAGDEAVMPLANIGGRLGVMALPPKADDETKQLLRELIGLMQKSNLINSTAATLQIGKLGEVADNVDGLKKQIKAGQ